jgi:ABC-type transport system involved in multi-copper enzyme maturation permease subunit
MLSLVWKDVSAARWFLLLILPLFAVQLVGLATAPPAFIVVTLLFSALLAFGFVGIEEIQGTEALWCSLPVSRLDVVLARYLTTLLGTVVGLGISWAVGSFAFGWMSRDPEGSTVHIEAGAYASLFFLIAVTAALYYPCYFRWGAGKGLQVFSMVVLGLVLVGAAGGSLLVSLTDGGPTLGDLSDPDPLLVAAVEKWIERWSGVIAVGLTVVALLGTCVSAALSAWLYETRDC